MIKSNENRSKLVVIFIILTLIFTTWTTPVHAEGETSIKHLSSFISYKADTIKMAVGEIENVKNFAESGNIRSAVSSDPEVVTAEFYENKYTYDSGMKIKALKPGTADITVKNGYGEESILHVTVVEEGESFLVSDDSGYIRMLGDDISLKKGYSKEFKSALTLDSQMYMVTTKDGQFVSQKLFNDARNYTVTTSDEATCKSTEIYNSYDMLDGYRLTGVYGGNTTVTLTVTDGDIVGYTKEFNVNVAMLDKAGVVKMAPANSKCNAYSHTAEIRFKPLEGDVEYKLYRSTSKYGTYKHVKTLANNRNANTNDKIDAYIDVYSTRKDGSYVIYENQDTLKANKKYYYKIKARRLEPDANNAWSAFSEPVAYYTAPKYLTKKQYSYNKRTRYLKISKITGAVGYAYEIGGAKKLGYNIYGRPVYIGKEQTLITTKRSFKVKSYIDGVPTGSVDSVLPYTKHNGLYYAHGHKLTTKPANFKKPVTGHKFAG